MPFTSMHMRSYMQTAALRVKAPPQTQQSSRFTQTSVMEMWKDTKVTTNANGEEEASIWS